MLVAPVHIQDVPEALPVSEKRLQSVAETLDNGGGSSDDQDKIEH